MQPRYYTSAERECQQGVPSESALTTAPLYHVGIRETYPPMRFVVSDHDMHGRYEQTMLLLSALSHFGHTNFDHIVMHGNHCEYVGKIGEDGQPEFGRMVYDFICCR